MKFLEIFLSVMGIIAIVAAAAFILIFLVDLFISISDKSNGIFIKRYGKNKEKEPANSTTNFVTKDATAKKTQNRVPYYLDEEMPTIVDSKPIEVGIDYEAAAREQAELEKLNSIKELPVFDDELVAKKNEKVEKLDVVTKDEDVAKDEDINEDLNSIEDGIKEDKIAKILEQYEDVVKFEEEKTEEVEKANDLAEEKAGLEEVKKEQEKDILASDDEADELERLIKDLREKHIDEDFDNALVDVKKEGEELNKEVETTNAKIEEIEEDEEETQRLIEEKDKEIQRLKAELEKSKKTEKVVEKPVVIIGGATAEELEVRLEVLLDRRKANAKELKKVKREYSPLNTIRKTLESDKKKLRRREAIVANQNTLLYGVNNYADIDDEKAKKLLEDRELLDGLKMSVKNCEEILEKNKDRFPVLEQAYNILVANKETIDKDIADVEEAINQLKSKK